MNRLISLVIIVVMMAAMFAGCGEASAADTKHFHEVADGMTEAMISDYGVTSVQYAIIDNGEIVFSGNDGEYAKGADTAITKDTMYGIASLSKMYVSAATMMLVDQDKVDLNAPLTTYIKDFKMADERYKEITPRMLLNHSSGLYGSHYHNTTTLGNEDTSVQDNMLASLQDDNLHSDPGAFSVYCNDGFQLLEILVERVSGMSYTEFVAENISKPLCLENTKTPHDDFDRERMARAYDSDSGNELPDVYINYMGTGGILSTAEDVCKFSEVLIGNKEDILSKESAEAMQNTEYRNGIWVDTDRNMEGYGLGWDSVNLAPFGDYGIKAVAKGGDSTYHSVLIALPEYNIAMAVASSGGSSLFNQIFASNMLLNLLKDKKIIDEIKPDIMPKAPVATEIPEEMMKYQGGYGEGSALQRSYDIVFDKDRFTIPEGFDGMIPEARYIYNGNGEFKNEDGTITLTFGEEENGKTYVQSEEIMAFPGIGQVELTHYMAMKLPKSNVSDDVMKTWEQRDGKLYLALLEKANSDMFLTPIFMINRMHVDRNNGYAQGVRIVDENNAVTNIEIPVMNGRDLTDLTFYQQEGAEYMNTYDMIYICEDSVIPLAADVSQKIAISANGYAQWFKIDGATAGKTIEVACPDGGSFAVYDKDNNLVNFSIVSKNNTCELPENGFIVFTGNASDEFGVTIK